MNLAAEVLGAGAVTRLQFSSSEHVLVVGSDKLTRAQLADVGCYNFVAAKNLTAILHSHPLATNLRKVFDEIPPRELAVPHMGVISLAVLGAAFEAKGIGGENPLVAYVKKHTTNANGKREVVTFDTIKHREHRRDQAAVQTRRKRNRR